MSIDKKEFRYLMIELKKIFASKPDLEALRDVINEDLLDFDPNVTYMGDEEPENTNVIWFDNDNGKTSESEITFDNPIISELFACIQTLQDQVQQLQADVEYLKLYGGGGGSSPDNPDNPPVDEVTESLLILEDGGLFLLEDGSSILLEESEVVIDESIISLEDGGLFLLENGGYMLLENKIESISSSLLLLENGAYALLENEANILLESNK